jgi:hypothetical protein
MVAASFGSYLELETGERRFSEDGGNRARDTPRCVRNYIHVKADAPSVREPGTGHRATPTRAALRKSRRMVSSSTTSVGEMNVAGGARDRCYDC